LSRINKRVLSRLRQVTQINFRTMNLPPQISQFFNNNSIKTQKIMKTHMSMNMMITKMNTNMIRNMSTLLWCLILQPERRMLFLRRTSAIPT
jgi:hypothetical protein